MLGGLDEGGGEGEAGGGEALEKGSGGGALRSGSFQKVLVRPGKVSESNEK